MKTDRPIIFHEPGILFAGYDGYMIPADIVIRKKVDKILSAVEGQLRRLQKIQEGLCVHPEENIENDTTNNTHQCMVCGKRSFKKDFK